VGALLGEKRSRPDAFAPEFLLYGVQRSVQLGLLQWALPLMEKGKLAFRLTAEIGNGDPQEAYGSLAHRCFLQESAGGRVNLGRIISGLR